MLIKYGTKEYWEHLLKTKSGRERFIKLMLKYDINSYNHLKNVVSYKDGIKKSVAENIIYGLSFGDYFQNGWLDSHNARELSDGLEKDFDKLAKHYKIKTIREFLEECTRMRYSEYEDF